MYLADRALADQLPRFLIQDRTGALAAHLEDPASPALRLNNSQTLLDLLHDRLLAVDVFARFHGVDRHAGVPMVGRGNDDGVDVLPRQHFFVFAGGKEILAVDFLRFLRPAIIDVANRDKLDTRNGRCRAAIPLPHNAEADAGYLNVAVRGHHNRSVMDGPRPIGALQSFSRVPAVSAGDRDLRIGSPAKPANNYKTLKGGIEKVSEHYPPQAPPS